MKYILVLVLSIIIIINIYLLHSKNNGYHKDIVEILKHKHNDTYLDKNIKKQIISENPLLIKYSNVLSSQQFNKIKNEALNHQVEKNRSKQYTSYWRKGEASNLTKLIKSCPDVIRLYMNNDIINLHKKYKIKRVPLNDTNSLGLLYYNKKDDHINWHYDFNYYFGKRYTALLCLENINKETGKISCAKLIAIINNKELMINLKPNEMVFFNGSAIKHRVSKSCRNDSRVMLTMIYCDLCQKNPMMTFYEKLQKFSFYG
jgi:hypothetical protein